MIVYKTTNLISGRIYIGKASGKRITNGYLGSGLELTPDIIKHGKEHFRRITIDVPENRQDQNYKEIFWIAFYRKILGKSALYNLADGGDGGDTLGTKSSSERKRIAEAKHSETAKRKGFWVGDKNPSYNGMPEERKRKISITLTGHPVTKETKQKTAASLKNKPKSEKHKQNLRGPRPSMRGQNNPNSRTNRKKRGK